MYLYLLNLVYKIWIKLLFYKLERIIGTYPTLSMAYVHLSKERSNLKLFRI